MEDNKKINTEEPLLYIHQPEFEKPDLKMQDVFHAVENNTEEKPMDKTIKSDSENNSFPDLTQEVMEHAKQSESEENLQKVKEDANVPKLSKELVMQQKKISGMRKVKSFREMSIDERLQYLSSFPISQPPYPCEFITDDARYQGFVINYDNHQVKIKTPEDIIDLKPIDVKSIRIIR